MLELSLTARRSVGPRRDAVTVNLGKKARGGAGAFPGKVNGAPGQENTLFRRHGHHTARTRISPSPAIAAVMVWPRVTAPTPSGVPEKITSPGKSSKYVDR
jgi:hypothetical protein